MSKHLLIIDGQEIFADSGSPWASPAWPGVQENLLRLAERFPVIRTRWIPLAHPAGSWRDYFEQWPFAKLPVDHHMLSLVPAVAQLSGPIIDRDTFGKWGEELTKLVGDHPRLIVTGVSTDCCVLSTALAAADAGAYVDVVTDACAGSSPENHEAALACLALYPPQIRLVTTEELIDRSPVA
ncbi:MAG: isochorismatase family protein [Flaviflexus sp.]|nr:isochorismatase family protein [Flaviflexus sp.]